MPDFAQRSFVKICGVTTVGDADLVLASGADALGVIVAESPRHVSTATARLITDRVRGKLLSVLVTRAQTVSDILDAVAEVQPDVVQLHDPPAASLLDELRDGGYLVIRALASAAPDFWTFDDGAVDAVLLDGPAPGSGVSHSWEGVERRGWSRPLIAAGGLTSSNVSDVIERPWVWGVDVVSGVERAPGVKDVAAVRACVERARRAFEGRP